MAEIIIEPVFIPVHVRGAIVHMRLEDMILFFSILWSYGLGLFLFFFITEVKVRFIFRVVIFLVIIIFMPLSVPLCLIMTSCRAIDSKIIEVDAKVSLSTSRTSSATMTRVRSNGIMRDHSLTNSALPMMVHVLRIEIMIVLVVEMMPGWEFLTDPSVVANLLEALWAITVAVLLLAILIFAALVLAVAVPEATPATSVTIVTPVVDFIFGHLICLLLLLLQVEE